MGAEPESPTGAAAQPELGRPPDTRLRPAPRLRRSAPSARPGPAVAAAECHGAIALPPPLRTVSARRSASSPEGARAEAFSGRREGAGTPAEEEGAERDLVLLLPRDRREFTRYQKTAASLLGHGHSQKNFH